MSPVWKSLGGGFLVAAATAVPTEQRSTQKALPLCMEGTDLLGNHLLHSVLPEPIYLCLCLSAVSTISNCISNRLLSAAIRPAATRGQSAPCIALQRVRPRGTKAPRIESPNLKLEKEERSKGEELTEIKTCHCFPATAKLDAEKGEQ